MSAATTPLADSGNGAASPKSKTTKKSADSTSEGQIKRLDMEITLLGRKPGVLHHTFRSEDIVDLLIRGDKPTKDKQAPLRDMAAKCVYREDEDPHGQIGFPTTVFMACLVAAGRKINLKGLTNMSKASGETVVFDAVEIDEEFLPMFNPETGKLITEEDWEVKVSRGRLPNGTACGLVRPLFKNWGLKFNATINLVCAVGFNQRKARELFNVAGRLMGLGAWRPSCKGKHGRFNVEDWNILAEHR